MNDVINLYTHFIVVGCCCLHRDDARCYHKITEISLKEFLRKMHYALESILFDSDIHSEMQ